MEVQQSEAFSQGLGHPSPNKGTLSSCQALPPTWGTGRGAPEPLPHPRPIISVQVLPELKDCRGRLRLGWPLPSCFCLEAVLPGRCPYVVGREGRKEGALSTCGPLKVFAEWLLMEDP